MLKRKPLKNGNYKQDGKITYRQGKNVGKQCDQQKINFQIIQITYITLYQKNPIRNGQNN